MTRQITITTALNGYICGLGCQQVVFDDRLKLVSELGRYLADPEKVEAEYQAKALNKSYPEVPAPMAMPPTSIAEPLSPGKRRHQ